MSQYVYFRLRSETVTAAEMTSYIGLEPDAVTVRGARSSSPQVVPVTHAWQVHCPTRARSLDDQTETVLARLAPVHTELRDLVRTRDVTASLVFVRNFNDDDGEAEDLEDSVTVGGYVLHRIAGQHQLLGWYLTSEQLAFLVSLDAGIEADEYG